MNGITPPASKSITQRALFVSALCDGESRIVNGLDCEDSKLLRAALSRFGVNISTSGNEWRIISSPQMLKPPSEPIYTGNAGTTMRFLSALGALMNKPFLLDGSERMRQRPFAPMGKALAELGVNIDYEQKEGFVPVRIYGPARLRHNGNVVRVDASMSSQFASALMMVAPLLRGGMEIRFQGPVVSRPYLELTARVMQKFGASVQLTNDSIQVEEGAYQPATIEVEADWSAAAFWFAAMFITGKSINLHNLSMESAQGDRNILQILDAMRNSNQPKIDLTNTPDLIAPVVAAALFANKKVSIQGIAHVHAKESDRVAVLQQEFGKLGAKIKAGFDFMEIEPSPLHGNETLDPHDDHRMAMAFGIVSLVIDGIEIQNRQCVRKSYPNFWEHLEQVRQQIGNGA